MNGLSYFTKSSEGINFHKYALFIFEPIYKSRTNSKMIFTVFLVCEVKYFYNYGSCYT